MHSPEHNRKKAEARKTALHHHQNGAVDGMRDKHKEEHEDMVQRNWNLDSRTTQYQNEHPGMSREDAFNAVVTGKR